MDFKWLVSRAQLGSDVTSLLSCIGLLRHFLPPGDG